MRPWSRKRKYHSRRCGLTAEAGSERESKSREARTWLLPLCRLHLGLRLHCGLGGDPRLHCVLSWLLPHRLLLLLLLLPLLQELPLPQDLLLLWCEHLLLPWLATLLEGHSPGHLLHPGLLLLLLLLHPGLLAHLHARDVDHADLSPWLLLLLHRHHAAASLHSVSHHVLRSLNALHPHLLVEGSLHLRCPCSTSSTQCSNFRLSTSVLSRKRAGEVDRRGKQGTGRVDNRSIKGIARGSQMRTGHGKGKGGGGGSPFCPCIWIPGWGIICMAPLACRKAGSESLREKSSHVPSAEIPFTKKNQKSPRVEYFGGAALAPDNNNK